MDEKKRAERTASRELREGRPRKGGRNAPPTGSRPKGHPGGDGAARQRVAQLAGAILDGSMTVVQLCGRLADAERSRVALVDLLDDLSMDLERTGKMLTDHELERAAVWELLSRLREHMAENEDCDGARRARGVRSDQREVSNPVQVPPRAELVMGGQFLSWSIDEADERADRRERYRGISEDYDEVSEAACDCRDFLRRVTEEVRGGGRYVLVRTGADAGEPTGRVPCPQIPICWKRACDPCVGDAACMVEPDAETPWFKFRVRTGWEGEALPHAGPPGKDGMVVQARVDRKLTDHVDVRRSDGSETTMTLSRFVDMFANADCDECPVRDAEVDDE